MKKMKSIWILLFTLVLLCSLSTVAFAESPSKPMDLPILVESLQEVEPEDPTPEVVEVIPAPSDAPESATLEEPETKAEATLVQEKSNTPYYVGAVFAVLLFAGVAVYCKCKGNR